MVIPWHRQNRTNIHRQTMLTNNYRHRFVIVFLLAVMLPFSYCYAQENDKRSTPGTFEYTLRLEDKTTVSSNVGQEPLVYPHETKQLMPCMEKRVAEFWATEPIIGKSERWMIPSEECYGSVKTNLIQEVPKENVPLETREVGKKLQGRGPDGQVVYAEVKQVNDETIVIDLNHPLAGKALVLEMKVLATE